MDLDEALDFGERWAFVPQVAAFLGIVWQGWSNSAVRGLALFLLATVIPSTLKAWRRRSIDRQCLDLEVKRFDIRYQNSNSKLLFDVQAHVKVTNRHEDRGLERWTLIVPGADGVEKEEPASPRPNYLKKNESSMQSLRLKFSAVPDLPDREIRLRLQVTGARPITIPIENPTHPPGYKSP